MFRNALNISDTGDDYRWQWRYRFIIVLLQETFPCLHKSRAHQETIVRAKHYLRISCHLHRWMHYRHHYSVMIQGNVFLRIYVDMYKEKKKTGKNANRNERRINLKIKKQKHEVATSVSFHKNTHATHNTRWRKWGQEGMNRLEVSMSGWRQSSQIICYAVEIDMKWGPRRKARKIKETHNKG
jgi:hypothetical protein